MNIKITSVIIILTFSLFNNCNIPQKKDSVKNNLGLAPGTYTIAGEDKTVEMPFEFYGMNLMVKAKMNGIDINMLIDNGVMWDELLFYGSDQVDSLGMVYEGDVKVLGAGEGEGIDSYTASNISITFGNVTFNGQNAVITPKVQGLSEFFPGIAGQVCGAFFKHFITEFNFDNQKLYLHQPNDFIYSGKGTPIKMTRDTIGSYSIPVSIKQKDGIEKKEKLFIDLGGIYPISLVLNDSYNLPEPKSGKIILGYGASGPINGYKSNFEEVTIGGYILNNVEVIFTESPSGSDHTNTTIGLPLMMNFNIVFDYFSETLYLEPNNSFNEPPSLN